MTGVIDTLERAQVRKLPRFDAGDRVKVHFQVVEGNRRRTQVFEGTVIKRQGHGARETFTVRKQSFGVGVERTFPLHTPKIERIEVVSRGDVRRAKLYYLRGRVGRRARVRERQHVAGEELDAAPEMLDEAGAQDEAPVADTAAEAEPAEAEAQETEGEADAGEDRAAEAETETPEADAGGEETAEGDSGEESEAGAEPGPDDA